MSCLGEIHGFRRYARVCNVLGVVEGMRTSQVIYGWANSEHQLLPEDGLLVREQFQRSLTGRGKSVENITL
jgi:hypothetical protein